LDYNRYKSHFDLRFNSKIQGIKPNKTLQLTPSRDALFFHDRLPILPTLTQEFHPLSG